MYSNIRYFRQDGRLIAVFLDGLLILSEAAKIPLPVALLSLYEEIEQLQVVTPQELSVWIQ